MMSFGAAKNNDIDLKNGHKLYFKASTFNPVIGEPSLKSDLVIPIEENNYVVIQLDGPIYKSELETLEASGAKLIEYIPDYSYIAKINLLNIETIRQLPFVTWIGSYHPGYKISEKLLDESGQIELNVKVFEEPGNTMKVADIITSLGGDILSVDSDTNVILASIDAIIINDLSFIPEIEWMGKNEEKELCMDIIRPLTGATTLHINGFDGTGIVGEVCEEGYDRDHYEFDGQILAEDGSVLDNGAHGTCTFGIIFAKGLDANAKGMSPGSQGVFASWNVGRYQSIQNLKNNWGGVYQSNSWMQGYNWDGEYNTYSEQNDQAIYDLDVSMLYAAGNYGNFGMKISYDSAAKNVICVGALDHYNTLSRSDDQWNVASYGPAYDGRIKPDLCAEYDWIYTTDVLGSGGYSSGDYCNDFGGTSGATPTCAGALGLVYELYKADHWGNNPSGANPHAATVKSLLINHAYQYPFSQATRYQQGWGFVDLKPVYENSTDFIVDEEYSLSTGQSKSWTFTASSTTPLKATLVWTDVPGTTSTTKHLKNDLSLKITDPNNNVYLGNYNLVNSHWSSSGGSEDHTNNVENIFIQTPLNGQYTVEVIAYNVVEPIADPIQDFSLVVSGIVVGNQPPTCTLTADPSSGEAPLTTTFHMTASDPDGTIASWELDVDNDGNAEYSGSGNPPATQQHTYTNPGEYTAKLTVWDNEGATGYDTTIVTVTEPNTPPDVPTSPNPADGATDVSLSPTLSVYVNDADGDTMTVYFYEQGGGLIGTDTVAGSGTASVVWTSADQYSTTYSWYTVADDGNDQTTSDPPWSFTTIESQPEKFYTTSDMTVQNSGISGSHLDTHDQNDVPEGITEAKTGPISKLEHKWTIDITGSYNSFVFKIDAYHTTNTEGDDFIFAYSTNNIDYTNMVTVTKTSDDDTYQAYTFTTSLA